MPEIFIRLIEATAWPMAAPKPYSPFHLLLTAAGLAAALLSAIALGKSFRKKTQKQCPRNPKNSTISQKCDSSHKTIQHCRMQRLNIV